MNRYVVLIRFTDQGIREIEGSPKRAANAIAKGKKLGVKVTEVLWTMGSYDGALLANAPDDETMTAFCLSISRLGNVKTQTLRAFSVADFKSVVGKLG